MNNDSLGAPWSTFSLRNCGIVLRVAARCSLDHLVVVLAAETCVVLANAWVLRKSNALADGSTRVDASFAMLYVTQVRRFRLITYWVVG